MMIMVTAMMIVITNDDTHNSDDDNYDIDETKYEGKNRLRIRKYTEDDYKNPDN